MSCNREFVRFVCFCFWSSESNCSIKTIYAFIVIVGAYIQASSSIYVGIEVSVFVCVSCFSMVSGHSVSIICSAIWLVSIFYFPEHGLEWWTCLIITFGVSSCHVQNIYMGVVWLSHLLSKISDEHAVVVHPSPWVSPVRCCEVSFGRCYPSRLSTDPFCLGHTTQYCSTLRSLIMALM